VRNFIVVLALLFIAFTYLYYYKYVQNRVPYCKYKVFHKEINEIDTIGLVLGSSHTFYGIDSKLLNGNVFNFASISQSLMEDFAILKHIKNPVKRVIIPISYFTNWGYLNKAPNSGERLRAIDYQSLYGVKYPPYLDKTDIINFISVLSKSISTVNQQNFDVKGNLTGVCDSVRSEINDAKTAFERHVLGKNFNQIHPYLDSIHIFCAKHKIELYLTVMPYTYDYRKFISNGGFDQYLEFLTAKYGDENCFLLDFRAHFEISEERLMFRDADHLSFCGRNAFSEFLNDQISLRTLRLK
jgi:hypothetical protein